MDASTQEIMDKFNQLPEHLQQQVIDYIDFLIWKYKIEIPTSNESETEQQTIEEQLMEEPTTIEQVPLVVEPENTETETTTQEEVEMAKETTSSPEDLQLDQQIEAIKEANKDKIAPNWKEVKKAFLDEFH